MFWKMSGNERSPQYDFLRLADGAVGRVLPERLVVGAAVVVAGEPEAARRPEDEERRRERDRARPPAGLRPEPGVRAVPVEERRVEGAEVVPELVMIALEGGPGEVGPEKGQPHEHGQGLRPPEILTRGFPELALDQRQ